MQRGIPAESLEEKIMQFLKVLMPGIADKCLFDEEKQFPASYHYVAKDNNTNGYESIPGVQYHLEYKV